MKQRSLWQYFNLTSQRTIHEEHRIISKPSKLKTMIVTTPKKLCLSSMMFAFILAIQPMVVSAVFIQHAYTHPRGHILGKRDTLNQTNIIAASTAALPEFCKKDKHEIDNATQLNQLQLQCHTLTGDLLLKNYKDPIINLGSIESIHGSWVIENSSTVVRVEAPMLKEVQKTFRLQSLTSLTSVYVEKLGSVDILDWEVVPILSTLEINRDLQNTKKIIISDTSLTGFDSFNNIKNLETFNLNNNRFMEYIHTNIETVSESLSIASNSRDMQVELKNLQWANNVTIRDCADIEMSSIKYVNRSMEFIENHFTELKLPNLQSVGGTLGILENENLNELDFNNITDIAGGVMVLNNTHLENLNCFEKLRQIGGAIQFNGNLKKLDFPKLKLIKGSVSISSNSNDFDCTKWTNPPNGVSIIRGGKIICSSLKKQTNVSLSENGEVLNLNEIDTDITDSSTDRTEQNKDTGKKSSKKTKNAAVSLRPINMKTFFGLMLLLVVSNM